MVDVLPATPHGTTDRMSPDRGVVADLYVSMAPRLKTWLVRQTRSPEEASDVLSEIFVVAVARSDTYDPLRGLPEQWLWGIARIQLQRWRNAMRRSEALVGRLTTTGKGPEISDSYGVLVAERQLAVRVNDLMNAMDQLAEMDRSVVQWWFIERATYQEIAHRTGCNVGAARVRVHRAKQRLRSILLKAELASS